MKRDRLSVKMLMCAAVAGLMMTDVSVAAPAKPVKVFILAGQSNMVGWGDIIKGAGDLETAAKEFPNLKKDGKWAERDDVWFFQAPSMACNLKVGLGANEKCVGPELQFGHVMGDYYEEPVLLIKCAWGGKSLAVDFRPPSSGEPSFEVKADKKGVKPEVGKYYRLILTDVRQALDNLAKNHPKYAGQGYELAGFFWHQGWNDACNKEFGKAYEVNMINFIKDIRKDLATLDKKGGTGEEIPFVIATSGMGGPDDPSSTIAYIKKIIEPAQLAAAQKSPNSAGVPTRQFQRHKPGGQKYHWYNSAESYVLVGDASGKAMIELLKKK